MAKKNKKKNKLPTQKPEKKPFNWGLLLVLVINSALVFGLYQLGNYYRFLYTFPIYFVLSLGFTVAYLLYNRGLSRDRVTPDMLPEDWSAEKKCEFFADRDRRKKKSKWMLTIIIPLFFTLAFDIIDLFYLDKIKELLKG